MLPMTATIRITVDMIDIALLLSFPCMYSRLLEKRSGMNVGFIERLEYLLATFANI